MMQVIIQTTMVVLLLTMIFSIVYVFRKEILYK